MEFKINAKRDEIARVGREHLGGGAYKKRLNDNTIGRIQKLAKDYASARDANAESGAFTAIRSAAKGFAPLSSIVYPIIILHHV